MRTSLLADEFLDLFHVMYNVRDCSTGSVDLLLLTSLRPIILKPPC
jgi:hypothetical protein